MGGRFTPLPFKDASKPIWPPLGTFLAEKNAAFCFAHINTSEMYEKRVFHTIACADFKALRLCPSVTYEINAFGGVSVLVDVV